MAIPETLFEISANVQPFSNKHDTEKETEQAPQGR